jgi:mannose-1-phosphate guanylyltransferase/mannose-6-phosphate isomerase
LRQAVKIVSEGAIAILGITPKTPETGYGYIKIKRTQSDDVNRSGSFTVERFVENLS